MRYASFLPGSIYIENPPPFRSALRGNRWVGVPLEEGIAAARFYLARNLPVAGFHHSDLDVYEAERMRGAGRLQRYDTFDYAARLRAGLPGFNGALIPHRIVVYEDAAALVRAVESLVARQVNDLVLVGRPYSLHPSGYVYRTSVEEGLSRLGAAFPTLRLGVIGIPGRPGEAERIADKFVAAGGRLRVMGQFQDEIDGFCRFLGRLAEVFEARSLDISGLQWNLGLAILALKDRSFYAKLLRKPELSCEARFRGLSGTQPRIDAAVSMNLEFAETALETAQAAGVRLGFSVQPIIERYGDGRLHPAVCGAALLVERLAQLVASVRC